MPQTPVSFSPTHQHAMWGPRNTIGDERDVIDKNENSFLLFVLGRGRKAIHSGKMLGLVTL